MLFFSLYCTYKSYWFIAKWDQYFCSLKQKQKERVALKTKPLVSVKTRAVCLTQFMPRVGGCPTMWVVYVTLRNEGRSLASRAFRKQRPMTLVWIHFRVLKIVSFRSRKYYCDCYKSLFNCSNSQYFNFNRKELWYRANGEVIDRAKAEAGGADAASASSEFRCSTWQV